MNLVVGVFSGEERSKDNVEDAIGCGTEQLPHAENSYDPRAQR